MAELDWLGFDQSNSATLICNLLLFSARFGAAAHKAVKEAIPQYCQESKPKNLNWRRNQSRLNERRQKHLIAGFGSSSWDAVTCSSLLFSARFGAVANKTVK